MTASSGPVRVPAGRDPLAAQRGGHGSARRHPRVGRGLLAGCTGARDRASEVLGRRGCGPASPDRVTRSARFQ